MRTIIEVKTGNVVDTGDTIYIHDNPIVLTDFNIPEYIAKGFLTFAQYVTPSSTTASGFSEAKGTIDDAPFYVTGKFNNPLLHAVFLVWGYNKGLTSEKDIMDAIKLMWTFHAPSVLSVALKTIQEEGEILDKAPEIVYTISMTDGKIKTANSAAIKCFDYIACFETEGQAKYAQFLCKEILDELF